MITIHITKELFLSSNLEALGMFKYPNSYQCTPRFRLSMWETLQRFGGHSQKNILTIMKYYPPPQEREGKTSFEN